MTQVRDGALSPEKAMEELKLLPYQDLGFAKIDHHRSLRKGVPEVVLGDGKTPGQVAEIARELAARVDVLMVTRATPETFEAVREQVPEVIYRSDARVVVMDKRQPSKPLKKGVTIVSAGTSDVPVAEEAAVTAELIGSEVERIYDVGVAGLHRLLDQVENLQRARVVIAVAGMEGALPGVVAGLVAAPVIALPTSIGYGAGLGGVGALMTMLNACAPGIAVVNIDNGFGAGYLASIINRGWPQSEGTGLSHNEERLRDRST